MPDPIETEAHFRIPDVAVYAADEVSRSQGEALATAPPGTRCLDSGAGPRSLRRDPRC